MRILYVSHSFPLPGEPLSNIGGMQRVAVDLHRALKAHPHVSLVSLCLEASWRSTGIRTGPFLFSLLRRIPKRVRRERIEVVLFSSMVTASVAALIGNGVRSSGAILGAIPVGRDLTLPNPIYQRMVPSVLRQLDIVFPISRATAAEALKRGANPDRVHVVPCGVEFDRFPGAESKVATRESLLAYLRGSGFAIPENPLLLLSVGRHQERKGFHWFVDEVMPLLPESAVYVVAGSGPMTSIIRERAARRGLAERVLLLGRVAEATLPKLYGGADLFIMPNIPVTGDIEGFGVVMLEAAAAGLPVIGADLEGIRDVITPGENGWLVASGNAPAFAERIAEIAGSADLAEVGLRAALHVRRRFGWGAIVEQHLAIFRALRGGPALEGEAMHGG